MSINDLNRELSSNEINCVFIWYYELESYIYSKYKLLDESKAEQFFIDRELFCKNLLKNHKQIDLRLYKMFITSHCDTLGISYIMQDLPLITTILENL